MSRFSHREANPPVILVHAALMAGLFTVMSSSTALAQATQPAKPTVAPDLTGLFTAPPTKVYKLSEGRTMTAAQIRAALDAQIAGKLKGPFLSARRTLSVKVIDPSQLARESAEIMAETKAAARQSANSPPAAHPVGAPAGRAPELHQESGRPVPPAGAPTARASELSQESARPVPPAGAPAGRAPTNNLPPGPSGATTTIGGDASAKAGTPQQPCAERSPYVATFKGTITPGGVIGLTGQCFGTSGEIRILGTNSNFLIKLQPAWTDTAIAATIPADITGQIDQAVEVEIVRADGKKSADLNKVFIAAKDPEIEVPADLVISVQCGNPAGCSNRQAVHQNDIQDNPPLLWGTDIWKVQLAKGWQLTTLST
jgi:hypothetical protein